MSNCRGVLGEERRKGIEEVRKESRKRLWSEFRDACANLALPSANCAKYFTTCILLSQQRQADCMACLCKHKLLGKISMASQDFRESDVSCEFGTDHAKSQPKRCLPQSWNFANASREKTGIVVEKL